MTCYLGVQAGNLLESWTGIELPWWLISAIMLLIVGYLGFHDIELSAKVLGLVLILEVVAVVAIDLGVLLSGNELATQPFSPSEAISGAPGLGLLFAFLGFFGFEATAVFRNDPARNFSGCKHHRRALRCVLMASYLRLGRRRCRRDCPAKPGHSRDRACR